MEDNQGVVFREGGFRPISGLKAARETIEKDDRIIALVKKISGGRIQSEKTATTIALIFAGIMFGMSLIWIF